MVVYFVGFVFGVLATVAAYAAAMFVLREQSSDVPDSECLEIEASRFDEEF